MADYSNPDYVNARYSETGAARFKGNPFIEALPKLESSKLKLLQALAHEPERPTAATRKASPMIRLMELAQINDIVVPFPEYEKAAVAMTTMIRETYYARNPLSPTDYQRRNALVGDGTGGMPFPSNWKSSGSGHLLISISGMGKTTLAQSFLLRYPKVIVHSEYKGTPLKCYQVPHLSLRVPHDGTLRALCLQFFETVDKLLGTQYRKEALGLRSIAPMALHMSKVATSLSLGLLVVDEVQNLRSATGNNAVFVLNLFSELIERAGLSLVIIATPAVQPIIEGSVRNGRKIAMGGETVLKPMSRDDPQWKLFCENYWDYTYTKTKGKLSKTVLDAWHKVSAGNSAFAATAFGLAQRHAIDNTEVVDEAAFYRVAEVEMAFLQPAIDALRSGDPKKLRQFDDLVFTEKFRALRTQLGIADPPPDQESKVDEFAEMSDAKSDTVPPRTARGSRRTRALPVEEPRELR